MLPDSIYQWIVENCADSDYPVEFWVEMAECFAKLSRAEQKWFIDYLKESINE